MKFIQIAVVQTSPYTQPNGAFCWGDATLFALYEDGNIWRNDSAGYDEAHWFKMTLPEDPKCPKCNRDSDNPEMNTYSKGDSQ